MATHSQICGRCLKNNPIMVPTFNFVKGRADDGGMDAGIYYEWFCMVNRVEYVI